VKDIAIDIEHVAPATASSVHEARPLVVPIRPILAPATANQWVRAVALGLALLAHAAALYALAREPEEAMLGLGGQEMDTISVTLVSSKVLESRDLTQLLPSAPAASNAVEATDGASVKEPAAAEQHEEKRAEEETREEKKPREEPIRTADAIFEVPKETQPQRQQQAAAPAAGAGAARSDTATDANASAPAAASAGAVREYAHNVAQALRKARPKGVGGSGTVRVKFAVALDGSVASVEIAKSSGNQKLDDIALEAVRRTKFQTPPVGLTSAERFYELPYYFR
jgi:protein TonB